MHAFIILRLMESITKIKGATNTLYIIYANKDCDSKSYTVTHIQYTPTQQTYLMWTTYLNFLVRFN